MRKLFALLGLSLLLISSAAIAQDSDGDGVDDINDLCNGIDASFFDADGDGCIDPASHARHVEFWAPEDFPISFVIHEDGATNLTDGSDFAAIQDGFAVWSTVPGVTLSSVYAGTTPDGNADGMDGINHVTFVDPEFLAVYGSAVLAVGITTSFTETTDFDGRTVRPGQIVDADMMFNPNRVFSTDSGGFGPDLPSVAAHEAGHLFGFAHSSVVTSTMFPALPVGTNARTLEIEDEILAFMSYPESSALAAATSISGIVSDGSTSAAIGGAAVFAIATATGDTLGAQYTHADGSYEFVGLPDGDYYVNISPLDGLATNGVVPGLINDYVDSIATNTLWNPEYWDLAESNADNDLDRDPITLVGAAPVTGIDIVTNVDLDAPVLVEIAPDGVDLVRADAVFFVEFDEPIDFDNATTHVVLKRMDGGAGTPVGFALLQVSSENVIIVDPAGLMDYATGYELVLLEGLSDRFGNGIPADITTAFSVEVAPPLTIRTASPAMVSGGTVAVIYGEGFDLSSPAANEVDFGGITVPASTVNVNAVSVMVPLDIPTGDFTLTVGTGSQTSNPLQMTAIISVDIVRGTDLSAVSLSGDPEAVALLPDATFSYVAESDGVLAVSTGAANTDFSSTELIQFDDGTVDVAVSPDGNRVYAVSRTSRSLIVINSDYGDINARDPLFNTVLDELTLIGEPLGIALDPSGQRAYIATASGQVEVWDIELGSATYHRQIGLLESPVPSLQGAIAVDRTGLRVLALTGSGDLLTWDSSNPTAAPLQEFVAGDPRDLTIDPQGTVAYASDGNGEVAVVLLGTGAVSQRINVGGTPFGMTVTPSGGRGYIADRLNDTLPALDLVNGSPSFRTRTGELEVGQAPVDVAVSPDGLYVLSLEQGSNTLRIVGVGQGPEVTNVEPRWVRPGDILTFTGSGFAAMDPDFGFTSVTRAYFGDEVVWPERSTTTSFSVVVPSSFTGGTVRASFEGPAFVNLPSEYFSNPATVRSLPVLLPEDQAKTAFLGASEGYLWDDVGVHEAVATSPTGKFMLAVSLANNAYMIDTDPASPDRGQVIGTIPMQSVVKPGRIAITPDGTRAYYSGTDQQIHILDTDSGSPTYLQEIGVVNAFQVFPEQMAILPSGESMVVEDGLNDQVYLVDLRPDSQTYHQALAVSGPLGFASDLDIHPSGHYAYFPASTGLVHVVDLITTSTTFFQQIATFAPGQIPRSTEFSPDGSRLYVLTRDFAAAGVGSEMEVYDTTDPANPVQIGTPQLIVEGSGNGSQSIWMSAQGDRMVADFPDNGTTLYLDVREQLLPAEVLRLVNNLNINGTSSLLSLAFSPDGFGFWAASRGDTGISFTDQVSSYKLQTLSGFGQIGVAGQPLAAPLVFAADDGEGSTTGAGAVAEVRITGGGGSLGNGRDYQWVTSDADGLFRVNWTMGPEVDIDPANPANRINFSMNDGFSVADNIGIVSVENPDNLPLSQIQVLPFDASTDVSLTSTVQTTFSRAVDTVSVDPTSLILRRQGDGAVIEVAYGFADANTRVSLIPLVGLSPDTIYEVVSTSGILDAAGGSLSNPTITLFTTQAPPALSISAVSPPAATVGTQVVISGAGFASVAADNTVNFGAGSTPAITTGPGFITAYVPLGATTGQLTVSANSQTSNGEAFAVLVPESAPLDEVISTVETGISIQSVAVTPDGQKAYTVSTETNEVLPVNLETFTNLPAIEVGSGPQGVVIHPDGGTAYVTNFGSGSVSVIDVSTDAVIETINVGTNPVELVASPIGDRLYVVNQLDQTLSVIDIDATSATYHTVVASAPTTKSTRGSAISPDGSVLYLGTADGFISIQLSLSEFGVVTSVPTGKSTKGAAITPDGTLLLLVTTTGEVLIVDVSAGGDNAVVATVPTTKSTKGAAITPDGSLLYLVQEGTDEIVVVELNISSSITSTAVQTPIVVTPVVVKTIGLDPDPGVIAFDPSGSGLVIVGHQRTSGQLTFINGSSTPFGQLDAYVEVHPQTLNLGSRGRYVTGIIELPAGFFVENIDLSSVLLNGVLAPVPGKGGLEDRNQDTINELVLKFDRQEVQALLPQGDLVPVMISGVVGAEMRAFVGEDIIRTIRPQLTHPNGGEAFYPGQQVDVNWISPDGVAVAYVDVYWSLDDGESWEPVAIGVADLGGVSWTVPAIYSDLGLIEVTLFDHQGEKIGIGISQNSFFVMSQAVPVVMQGVDLGVRDGSGLIEWRVADAGAVEGFHVLRADREDGEYERVSSEVVTARPTPEGMKFVFEDEGIFANRDYFYILQEDRLRGAGFDHGPYKLNWALQNALYQNTPNTFNPRTTISFSISQDGPTRLVVYNVAGRLVDVLVDEVLRADTYEFIWEGKDENGRGVASGVYLYHLTAPGFSAAKKMTLVR